MPSSEVKGAGTEQQTEAEVIAELLEEGREWNPFEDSPKVMRHLVAGMQSLRQELAAVDGCSAQVNRSRRDWWLISWAAVGFLVIAWTCFVPPWKSTETRYIQHPNGYYEHLQKVEVNNGYAPLFDPSGTRIDFPRLMLQVGLVLFVCGGAIAGKKLIRP
jgi:hypothetical protein